MNTTTRPTSLSTETQITDDFAHKIRHGCQLFRFYASIILVIVGKI